MTLVRDIWEQASVDFQQRLRDIRPAFANAMSHMVQSAEAWVAAHIAGHDIGNTFSDTKAAFALLRGIILKVSAKAPVTKMGANGAHCRFG